VTDPWATDADTLVKAVSDTATDPAMSGVILTTTGDPGSLLTMFDVAERIRREVGTLVVAQLPERYTDLAVGALVSERIDVVDLIAGAA
jgi:anthraniloyl-CoA monooxygenase